MTRFVTAATLCAALGAAGQPAPARTWPAALRECAVNGIEEPVRCGTVRVPESNAPRARSIDLRVVVLPARTGTPAADPVMPLAGGPGQGAADLAGGYARATAILRNDRDILLIDQRGTGQSNGLTCDPVPATAALMGKLFDPSRIASCRDTLAKRADLTQYTTAAAAADYPRVWDALGYRQVNVIGTSYGSRLGLELARRFPARVRTLTIEAVAPVTLRWPSNGAPDADAALNAVIEDCRADPACARAYPRFAGDIDRAFARVTKQPVKVEVNDRNGPAQVSFGPSDLAYTTRGVLYGDDALSLPQWFSEAAAGSFDRFAQAYVDRARRLEWQIARGVHLGIYCAEDLTQVDWPAARAAATGTRIGTFLLDQYRAACAVWPRASVPASYFEPVRSSVPTLLMSGRRDPVTPPRTGADAARTLPISRLLTWRFGAHANDGLVQRDCRSSIVRAFVQSADLSRLPTGCMESAPLPFNVR